MPDRPSILTRSYHGFLFDMDGTLINSVAAAERVWARWADRHGLDAAVFLPTVHGVRAEDTIRRQNLPGIDVAAEVDWVTHGEIEEIDGVVPIPGVVDFLASLPPERWTIVTSASRDLAHTRLRAAGLEPPAAMITAEHVTRGKPAPDCFLLGAKLLGVASADCLVFEDSVAGIAAGEQAGSDLCVITSANPHPVSTPHFEVHDYSRLSVRVDDNGRLRLDTRG